MLERVLDLMEQRNGVRPDLASGATHRNVFFPTLYYFLFEDPLFQEWLLQPGAALRSSTICSASSASCTPPRCS